MTALPADPEAFIGDFEIRLRPDADEVLAKAAPEIRRNHRGEPNLARLLRKPRSTTPTNLFVNGMLPGNNSLARMAILHGHRRGIDPFDALRELCSIVAVPAARREKSAA